MTNTIVLSAASRAPSMASNPVRTLVLTTKEGRIKSAVGQLLDKMQSSAFFEANDLQEWQELFQENETHADGMLTCLYLLYEKILYPSLLACEDEGNAEAIVSLEDEFKKVLQLVLPAGKSIDKFLEESRAEEASATDLCEKLTELKGVMEKEETAVYRLANRENGRLKKSVDKAVDRLDRLAEARQSAEIDSQMDALTEQFTQVNDQLSKTAGYFSQIVEDGDS